MANLGNAWHLPANSEPRGRAGMRDPVFPTIPAPTVTVTSGNQFQGGGNPGNQLQDGSTLSFKLVTDAEWRSVPLAFTAALGNNKYYSGTIPTAAFKAGAVVQYYLRIAYDDHDTTFLCAGADGRTSVTTGDEKTARSRPFTFTMETTARRGRWSERFALPNVAIHASVLPNGRVLMWGRRDRPDQSLDTDPPSPLQPGAPPAPRAQCTPFVWDPTTRTVAPTAQPVRSDGTKANANLFCSGHSFLPDGRLFVAGGHLADGMGLNYAATYDPATNSWTATAMMNNGRWYPTVLTLPDGGVLTVSGSFRDPSKTPPVANNVVPQIWRDGRWSNIRPIPVGAFDLYPRLHLASTGVVYLTSLVQTWSLDVVQGGTWRRLPNVTRINGVRDYAPSVLYDVDRIVYIGGGIPPTANAEIIDVSQPQPKWQATGRMHFPRRQHNATILPDGTVLVTGGTRGGGVPGTAQAFNDLAPGQPVHVAELWDPATGAWTELAAEATDRCYHATAVLLPDATVLSAGGGEFFSVDGQTQQNDPQDSHRDAQVFSPPYLFKGPRPEITSAPSTVRYGDTFDVGTPQAAKVRKVSWVGLSSVTHAFNMTQRINFLRFEARAGTVKVTAPATPNVSPPGHYMLFVVSDDGVPSVARIVRIGLPAPPRDAVPVSQADLLTVEEPATAREAPLDAFARHDRIREAARGTRVVVGVQSTCPYGLDACWGAANEALGSLEGVEYVDPIPDGASSTATVYLEGPGLPALDRWPEQFRRMVNESYLLRGVEVTLEGTVEGHDGTLVLQLDGDGRSVALAPLDGTEKIQWDRPRRRPQPVEPGEAAAYDALAGWAAASSRLRATVTGPLRQTERGYRLHVRLVER